MRITVDLDTQLVTLPQSLRIKAGSQVPVAITFLRGGQPVTINAQIELALAPKIGSSGIVAYAEEFSAVAGPAYTGVLDCNDARLLTAIANKTQLDLIAELVWIESGQRFVTPSFAVFAEPPILVGPQSSQAGPTYLTALQCDDRFEQLSRKGQTNGYAALGDDGKVPVSQLPELSAGSANHTHKQIIPLNTTFIVPAGESLICAGYLDVEGILEILPGGIAAII